MVFKMSSQPVRCKQVRSQVRSNNNPRFYFFHKRCGKNFMRAFCKKHPYAQFIAQYASQKYVFQNNDRTISIILLNLN